MPARLFFYRLPEFSTVPSSILGKTGKLLAQLWELAVPIPAAVCIPTDALQAIAKQSDVRLKLDRLQRSRGSQHHTELSRRIVHIIKHQHIPQALLTNLAQIYHSYLQSDTVQILVSNSPELPTPSLVQGDANLIESILETWGESIAHNMFGSFGRVPLDTIIAPSPLILLQQPQPIAAGTVHTFHPITRDKTVAVIDAVWGVASRHNLDLSYRATVDLRTQNITTRKAHRQTDQLLQGSESLLQEPLSSKLKQQQPLTDEIARYLATVALKIKRTTLEHLRISWIMTDQGIFITQVTEIEPSVETQSESNTPSALPESHNLTQLFITGGNPEKAAQQLAQPVDGVGILKSEYTFARFGTHPLHVIRGPHSDMIRQALLRTIREYQIHSQNRLVLFRTENFTSSELLQLEHSASYTEPEPNPILGIRGALKNLQYPDLFRFQLEVFRQALDFDLSPLGLVIPFVRSSEEARRILQMIPSEITTHERFAGVWLQLNTPENVLSLKEYPVDQVAGCIIHASSIASLMRGVDPDRPELLETYSFDINVFELMIKQCKDIFNQKVDTRQGPHPNLLVYFKDYHSAAVAAAIRLGVNGLVVRPSVAQLAKACIMDTESQLVLHSRPF